MQTPNDLYQHLCKLLPELEQFQKDKMNPISNLECIS